MFNKILNRAALKINNQVREIIKLKLLRVEKDSSRWSKNNFKWQVGKQVGWENCVEWLMELS